MLEITIPGQEIWREDIEEFSTLPEVTIKLEHSLVSLSKWEAKYKKPFLGKSDHTALEMVDYIKFMTITQNVPEEAYFRITQDIMNEIKNYIDDPMTATTFSKQQEAQMRSRGTGEKITSELIYYWMIALQIPFECQKWHLNRLLTLIQVCNLKNTPPKKMSRNDILSQNRALNKARRAAHGTKG